MFCRFLFALCATAALTMPAMVGALERGVEAVSDTVTDLVARAGDAHAHLMRGDIQAYRRVIELTNDFTLMDPFGGRPSGPPQGDEHWNRIGRFFRAGRAAVFEPIASYRSGDLVVLVANEHANVAVGSLPAQDWSLRVTLVFRREDGKWKLVHRHADPLVRGISLDEAARLAVPPQPE